MLGALEHHVLDEMRNSGLVRLLFTRAGADPQAHRDAADVRHPFSDNAYTIGQDLAFDFPGFRLARLTRHLYSSYREGFQGRVIS
jgi:hypothetical protein